MDRGTFRRRWTLSIACSALGWPAFAQGLEWAHSPALDLGVTGGASSLAVFDDGTGPAVYVGGDFTAAGGIPALNIARWNGASWSALGQGLDDLGQGGSFVGALAVHDDGTGSALYAGGSFINSGSTLLRSIGRWNGSAWTPLGSGAGTNGIVEALATFDDGTGPALYMGGGFNLVDGVSAPQIARWNGTTWSALPPFPLPVDYVTCLAVHTDASGTALYAGGLRNTGIGQDGFIARLQGNAWTEWTIFAGYTYCTVLALHSHDDGTGPALYAAGRFLTAGGVPARQIARRIGGAWSQVGTGFSLAVGGMLTYDDGTGPALYACGGFNDVIDGVSFNQIARWNSAGWSILGRGITGSNGCNALCAASLGGATRPDLYATGVFVSAGGSPAHNFARWMHAGDAGGPYCFGDGSGLQCPCGNASAATARAGCTDSFGVGGRLEATGAPHVANDTLVLTATQLPPHASVLYFQGTVRTNGGGGNAMGDGLRCASGSMVRMGVRSAVQDTSSFPGGGSVPVHILGGVSPGATRMYQAMYRNMATFCTPSGFNTTNGWVVAWSP